MRTFFVLFLFACLLGGAPASARAQSPTPLPLTNAAEAQKPLDPAAATKAWLATVPAEKREKSDAYFEGGYWLLLWNFLLTVAIALFLLGSGLSARLRDFAERQTDLKALQVTLYALAYLLIVALLSFPLGVYEQYFREHAYGLATQSFGPWLKEQFIALVVTLIFTPLVLIVLYAVFRRAPRTWWLWGTGVAVAFLVLSMLISPIFIEPLFNTYKPLADRKISEPILAMAAANQIPVRQVFEVDASRQSNRVSANVAGIFGTARIALNDNLLKQCTLPEIRAVMAHEMGHYVLNHAFKLILYYSIFFFVGFILLRALFDRCVRKWGERWGVRGIADPAGLPLLALIFSTYFFFLTPIENLTNNPATIVPSIDRDRQCDQKIQ